MNNQDLRSENIAFAGTTGISENNRGYGFKPAFLDESTGRIEVARLIDGQPAPIHVITWLPLEWANSVTSIGTIESLKEGIISGFELDGVFYTRDEAAEL